jgi:glutamate N-acetyltransferase/amino-acid N-acetyltransferase
MQLPLGFRYAGIACGIKASGKEDLAIISTDQPAVCTGVYTQNIVRAASIDWNRQLTPCDNFRALVVNSGNANACTGTQGVKNNQTMACEVADQLDTIPAHIGVLSTGIIGVQLPMDAITNGIASAVAGLGREAEHFAAASRAITTTDKSPKTAHLTYNIDGDQVRISAMAKGAGMIGPSMATMLGVVMTDATITPTVARSILQTANEKSFNRISVEGHMSTNDAVMLIATGKSKAKIESSASIGQLTAFISQTCVELAKQIPSDGEGSTHLIEIKVAGAKSDADADRIARTVANSALVKTAITGCDPNWGRIVSAVGYAGADINADAIGLKINGHPLFTQGQPVAFEEKKVSEAIAESFETKIDLTVGNGPGQSNHWTSDLTVDYVRFNSEYTT